MRYISLLGCFLTVMGISAESKLNGLASNLIYNHSQQLKLKSLSEKQNQEKVDVLVLMKDNAGVSELLKYEAVINWFDGEIASVTIPIDKIEAMSEDDSVEFVEYGLPLRPMLNFAREDGIVNEVQDGFTYNGITQSFTGKGVITGLMDNGIDPNHINFQGDDGTNRVKAVYHYLQSSGTPLIYTTEREIRRFQTDDTSTSHGTHVAGIMAGGYKGEGTYGWISSDNGTSVMVKNGDIPYFGVATESDIAMAGGPLSQSNIISAVTNIFDFAEQKGQPCVVNLSLGSTGGPYDGTDLFGQSIAKQAKRGIITISSGNDGDQAMYVNKTFTSTDNVLKTFIKDNLASGNVEVWSNDSNPVKVTVALYALSGGTLTEICSVANTGLTVSSTSSNLFKQYYSGAITMTSSLNNLNKLYNVAISLSAKQLKSGQNIAIIVEGNDGQTARVYGTPASTSTDGVLFTNNKLSGWTSGTCDGSLNSLACAEGVISVGAYTSRTTWPLLSGQCYTYTDTNFSPGEISPFSSWGQKFNGEWLPSVCGPGANIISSYNTYETTSASSMSASAVNGSKTNYWGPMQGTSMSSPFVAGTIALWLEADPTLTSEEVLNIIKATSISPEDGMLILPGQTIKNRERWGAGKIDALAGIKKVLDDKAGVGSIFADDSRNFIVTPVDGGYNVYVAGESTLTVTLYDMSGRAVATSAADGNTVDIATSSLAKGIYLLAAQGNTQRHSTKIALR